MKNINRDILTLSIRIVLKLFVLIACLASEVRTGATVITNCTESAFTNALNSGGTIKFECSGVLELTSSKVITNTIVIDCQGQNVIFSGGGSNRLFTVMQDGELTLRYGTLSNGMTAGADGANGATAWPGGNGIGAVGGAILVSNGAVNLQYCTLVSNKVLGGKGGNGGNGTTVSNGGSGGKGGDAMGGAIYNLNGSIALLGCLFQGNLSTGGGGGNGGNAGAANKLAGEGGVSSQAFGGDICSSNGLVLVTNCTFYGSAVHGGSGGNAGTGSSVYYFPGKQGGAAYGGSIYSLSTSTNLFVNVTFANGSATGGGGGTGPGGYGGTNSGYGGLLSRVSPSQIKLMNTIAGNSIAGGNAYGAISDGGNNISSDTTCNFVELTSKNNTSVGVGELGDYGGPTFTVPLLVDSPCINGGDENKSLLIDQREFYRKDGPDIGAFEYGGAPYVVSIEATGPYASEEGTDGFVTIRRFPASGELTVGLNITGSAQNGVDYQALTNIITFSNTISYHRMYVRTLTDLVDDNSEYLRIRLNQDTNYLSETNPEVEVAVVETNPDFKGTHFSRGSSSALVYKTYVTALGNQVGVSLDAIDGNVTNIFPSNPWSETYYQFSITNSGVATNLGNRIPFKNPLAAFGSRVGGSEMIIGKNYSFEVYAGSPNMTVSNVLSIRVFSKTNCSLINEANISFPAENATNEWNEFYRNERTITIVTNGLTTSLKLESFSVGGQVSSNNCVTLTHKADNEAADYIYEISLLGSTDEGAMILDGATNQCSSKLYTMEFTVPQPWRVGLLDRDYFNSRIAPPIYNGKTPSELLIENFIATNIVNLSPESCTNLDNTPELWRHPVLDDFVASYKNDPLELVNFVFNEIELTDAVYANRRNASGSVITDGGVERGAAAVFSERRGSPTEQCALLVYLLRQAGVPAAYMYPTNSQMQMSESRLSKMLRLQLDGINMASGKAEVAPNYSINYPWVAAYIGTNWVHLFPWIKDTEIVEGFNIYDFFPDEFNSGYKWSRQYLLGNTNILSLSEVNTPNILFKKHLEKTLLENAPGLSIDDMGMRLRGRKGKFTKWTDFPIPDVIPAGGVAIASLSSVSNALPSVTNIFNQVSIKITSKANPTNFLVTGKIRSLDLHNRQLLVWYYATNSKHQMIMTLSEFRPSATNRFSFLASGVESQSDTNVVNTLSATNILEASEKELYLEIEYIKQNLLKDGDGYNYINLSTYSSLGAPEVSVYRKDLYKGDLTAICFDVGAISAQMTDANAERYWGTQRKLAQDPEFNSKLNPEIVQGPLASLIGYHYLGELDVFREAVSKLHKMTLMSWDAIAVVNFTAATNGSGNLFEDRYAYTKVRLDVISQNSLYAANASVRSDRQSNPTVLFNDFNSLFAITASAEEHQVFNRFFSSDKSVSTVTMLQEVAGGLVGGTNGVLELNIRNYKSIGDTIFTGVKLKDVDPLVWAKVDGVFGDAARGPSATVYMTPGVVTNSYTNYVGVGAMIFAQGQFAALLERAYNQGDYVITSSANAALFAQQSDWNGASVRDSILSVNYGSSRLNSLWGEKYSPKYTLSNKSPYAANAANEHLTLTQMYGVSVSLNPYQGVEGGLGVVDNSQLIADGSVYDLNAVIEHKKYSEMRKAGSSQDVSIRGVDKEKIEHGNTGQQSYLKAFKQMIADPVDAVTGYFHVNETDLSVETPIPLLITRNYSSGDGPLNNVGVGWKFGMFHYLLPSEDEQTLFASDMAGSVLAYRSNAVHSWQPHPDDNPAWNNTDGKMKGGLLNVMNSRIIATTNISGQRDAYFLYGSDGSIREFKVMEFPINLYNRKRPYLVKWSDVRQNWLSFSYGTNSTAPEYGELVRIEANNGVTVSFDYGTHGRVDSVRSSDGRAVNYEYDTFGDLIKVVLPDETTRSYEYEHVGMAVVTNQTSPVYYYPAGGWTRGPSPDGVYRTKTQVYFYIYQTNAVNIINGVRYTNIVNHLQYYTYGVWPLINESEYYFSTNYSYTTNVLTMYETNRSIGNDVSSHLLIKEIKPGGRVLENVYDTNRRVVLQYSTAGSDLVPVLTAGFAYSNNFDSSLGVTNKLTGITYITNALGAVIRYAYTSNLIEQVDEGLGVIMALDWYTDDETNKAGFYPRSVEMETDSRGLSRSYRYDIRGNVTNIVFSGDIVGDGGIASVTNSYTYSTNNLLLGMLDSFGNEVQLQYGDTYPFLMTNSVLLRGSTPLTTNIFVYGDVSEVLTNGNLILTNSAKGLLTRAIAAAGGTEEREVEFSFNGKGFLDRSIAQAGYGNLPVTNSFAYDNRGNVVFAWNGAGHQRKFEYDVMGRVIGSEVRDQDGNAMSWGYLYYNDSGEVVWADGPKFDPEDYVWFDYDGAGRKTQEVRWRSRAKADGSGVEAVPGADVYSASFYEYDGFGNLTRKVDSNGSYVTNSYDAIGRLIEARAYDAVTDSFVSTNRFAYEPGGQVAVHTNALGGITRFYYTSTGKLKRQENADGSVLEWRYYLDGRLHKAILSNGSYWETEYDDLNRKVTRRFKQANGTLLATESSEFDRFGNLIKATDAEGYTAEMTYDGLGRLKSSTGPVTVSNVSTQQVNAIYYDATGTYTTNVNALGEYAVTVRDALGRVVTNDLYTAAGALLRRSTAAYSVDHNSVTTTSGTGTNVIVSRVFTDTFGMPVISHTFANGVTNIAINTYDILGNLTSSKDVLGQTTTFTYDGLSRLLTQTLPDGAVTAFGYDPAGNLTSRTMPGGTVWSAIYDSSGRTTSEQMANGASVTRSFSYTYYPSTNVSAGLLSTVSDPRGITRSYVYDDYLRLALSASSGALSGQNQTNAYTYDKLGRVHEIAQVTGGNPSTLISRSYDGYGQLYDEEVTIDAASVSHFTQKWDAAGRRRQLAQAGAGTGGTIDYWYLADGSMSYLEQGGLGFGYAYNDKGQLDFRENGFVNRLVASRDSMGRPLAVGTAAVGGVFPTSETLSYRADSTLSSYSINRAGIGAWNESKSFTYNNRGQLTQETLAPFSGGSSTYQFGFDAAKLGVLVSADLSGAVNASWAASSLDAFSRAQTESLSVTNFYLQAKGYAAGAGSVSVALDGNPLGVYYDSSLTNGLWLADMAVSAGSHTLKATAVHPLGVYTNSATNTFTVLAKAGSVTNAYDAAGNVILRSFPDGRVQSLTWDAAGRLLQVLDRNSTDDGYDWSATYDAMGRRLRTVFQTVTNDVAQTNSLLVTESFFDPMVEFQELAVSVNGERTWKVYGPDLNGYYGGLQGVGGLEATIRESDGQVAGLVNDAFGNVVAAVTGEGVVWSPTKVNGYGPLPGFEPLVLTTNVSLAEATVWRGKRIDPTGLYWLGARYYDPADARFISTDPFGLGSDPSLYAAFWGDPVNYFDSDGRLAKRTANYFYSKGGIGGDLLRNVGGYLEGYETDSLLVGAWTGYYGSLANTMAAIVTPETYVHGLKGYGNNVSTVYRDGGGVRAGSYALTSWNMGAVIAGVANQNQVTGAPLGDWIGPRGQELNAGVAGTAGVAAGGLSGYALLTKPVNSPPPTPSVPLQTVNIDSSTARALVAENSPVRHAIKSKIGDSHMVMTQTAEMEFREAVNRLAGAAERARADRFLNKVKTVVDEPSPRVAALKESRSIGLNDKLIFGTGDNFGWTTFTSDAKFLRAAEAQGVKLSVEVHPPYSLTGQ